MSLRKLCKRFTPLLAALALLIFISARVLAAAQPGDLVKSIEKANILGKDYPVSAYISGQEAEVSTYRNPKATDKDCKIDAVLIAKEVMHVDQAQIKRVKVLFYDATNVSRYRQVMVREGDVKAFAAHALSTAELLASIDMTNGETPGAVRRFRGKSYRDIMRSAEVVDGPLKGERLQMLVRIQALKERGAVVQPLTAQFLRIEDKVRTGQQGAVINALNSLNEKLNLREESYSRNRSATATPSEAQSGTDNGPLRGVNAQSGADPGLLPGPDAQPSADHGLPHAPAVQPQGPLRKLMYERMAQDLGNDAPAPGPMPRRRYRIARKIRDLQEAGKNVDEYRRAYLEIEKLAARADLPALTSKIQSAEHNLGLTAAEPEDHN